MMGEPTTAEGRAMPWRPTWKQKFGVGYVEGDVSTAGFYVNTISADTATDATAGVGGVAVAPFGFADFKVQNTLNIFRGNKVDLNTSTLASLEVVFRAAATPILLS